MVGTLDLSRPRWPNKGWLPIVEFVTSQCLDIAEIMMLSGPTLQREPAAARLPAAPGCRAHDGDGQDAAPHILSMGAIRPLHTVYMLLYAALHMEEKGR